MDPYPDCSLEHPSLSERIGDLWDRGLRIAKRLAVAFGLSLALAIGVGFAVTENAFAQIIVTALAAIGFWIPMLVVLVGIEGMVARRQSRLANKKALAGPPLASGNADESWRRLAAAAPGENQRLLAVQRSLDTSRQALGAAKLDPDAKDLCVLIDRRLPELIDHQLDSLPPDDRGRRRQIGELVDLVEQFARHCSRKRDGDMPDSRYQAEILRRRFEDRLTGAGTLIP